MKINLAHVAKLANIPLTDEQIKKLEPQLEETLSYIEQLNEVDTKNVESTSNLTGLTNIMDEDVARPSLSQKEALSNAKATEKGSIKVKGIFDNE